MNLMGLLPFQKGKRKPSVTPKAEREHPAFQYGTDAEYLDFVSRQPSCIDGAWNQIEPESRNIACHVRRLSKGAGFGIKPPFSAVPMTHNQHMIQSGNGGEVMVLEVYTGNRLPQIAAAEWFERQADKSLASWIESKVSSTA